MKKHMLSDRVDRKMISLIVITVVLTIVMGAFNPAKFYTLYNFQSMTRQLAEMGVYSLALFVIVVSGGLNLSIVAIANLSAICGGVIMQGLFLGDIFTTPTVRLIVGILVSLVVGVLCGVLNGYFVAGLGLTAVLITSASMQFFQGLSLLITKGSSIMGAPSAIQQLGAGNLGGILPYLLILVAICYALTHFLFEKTAYGEQCRLLGANSTANQYSGNSNFKTLMYSYMLSGLFSAVGGLVSYSRMCVLRSDYGDSLSSTAMLVVLMGGAWVVAGGGKVVNIFISLFCLQIISSGLTLAGTSNFTRNTLWGLLLLALLLSGTSQVKNSAKKLFARLRPSKEKELAGKVKS